VIYDSWSIVEAHQPAINQLNTTVKHGESRQTNRKGQATLNQIYSEAANPICQGAFRPGTISGDTLAG
jgi:hypothetical protein